ncbi:MAG: flagellar biosynthetic protein FliR [Bacillota bacterium]
MTTGILINDFVITLLIFMRIISVFLAAPVLGHRAFPAVGKVFLAALLSYITFLTIVKGKQLQVDTDFFSIAFFGLKEVVTGLVIGYVLNFVFYGINYAGTLIGVDMGLSMASVMNPMLEIESNALSEVINIFALLLFFLVNGHHYLIRAMVSSFNVIPIGKYTITQPVFTLMIKYSALVFVIAIKIAAPIMVSFFLVHLGEGIIARAIPQMQVFFVTQPLKLGIGFLLLIATLPVYVYFIKNLLMNFEGSLFDLIRAMGAS